jgi:hypothetical protein
MVYQTFALWITEYDKAAKILVDKESNIRLAKLDATVHMDAAKEHQVNTFGTDVIIFFLGGGLPPFACLSSSSALLFPIILLSWTTLNKNSRCLRFLFKTLSHKSPKSTDQIARLGCLL